MKNIYVFAALFFCSLSFGFQLNKDPKPKCKDLLLDIEKGTLNGISPTAAMQEIKAKLPCFSGESEEGGSLNCGGGVFYIKHDFYFYTYRDYIEVRTLFSGKLSKPILNMKHNAVKGMLGEPIRKNGDPKESETWFYKMPYGTLAIVFWKGISQTVQLHAVEDDKIIPC